MGGRRDAGRGRGAAEEGQAKGLPIGNWRRQAPLPDLLIDAGEF